MVKRFLKKTARLGRQTATGHLGWMRGAAGGVFGVMLAGGLTLLLMDGGSGLPWLFAPLGASAVLVFVVPASPLAQPWPLIGGNLISAAIGIALGHVFVTPLLTAGIAVGAAIAAMSLARCLHPPGGACALLCALGATGPEAWDWGHLIPITANVLALGAAGWVYNNLTGHPWPHHAKRVTGATGPWVYRREDLEAVLADWDELLDVDVDDLDALFRAVERRVMGHPAKRRYPAIKKARQRL